jgi:hypothetical protein
MLKKKIWPNFPRNIEVLTQKIVTRPSKIWVWDLRSGIRKKPIPDPGVKKAPDPRSGSATLLFLYDYPDPQHCFFIYDFLPWPQKRSLIDTVV